MNRRDFLKTIIVAGTAPAFVKAESLMSICVPDNRIITPRESGQIYVDRIGLSTFQGDVLYEEGSRENPFRSLQEACKHARKGDYIYVTSTHVDTYESKLGAAIIMTNCKL